MRADNSRFITQAARDRRQATLKRAQDTLQHLDRDGKPITFQSVAQAASVSRAWLYRQPHLRAEIDHLRRARPSSNRPTAPAAQRGTDESQQRRIEALLDENKRLNNELRHLRTQLAVVLGDRRAAGQAPRS